MEDKPNIFLFVMDTARKKNLSAYSYERETTPFLKSCAKKGFKFENAVANSIWTYPSHVSMFTGMYPHEHGRLSKYDRGEILHKSFIEKHLTDYKSIAISNNAWISSVFGFDTFFDRFSMNDDSEYFFEEATLIREFERREEDWDSALKKYGSFVWESIKRKEAKSLLNGADYIFNQKFLNKITSEEFWSDDGAKEVLQEISSMDFDAKDPKFTFVNFIEPHSPYAPPKEFFNKFCERDIEEFKELVDTPPWKFIGEDSDRKEEILIDFYDASLRYMDHMLKEIHDDVESSTERDNVFIFVGDHGEMFNNDGLWSHGGGFRKEVLNIPVIVKGYEQGEESRLFELREIGRLVKSIVENERLDFGVEEAYSDYLGLNSHILDEDKIPEGYDSPKVAKINMSGELEVASSLSKSDGKMKEHLRALKMKKNRNNI